MKFERFKNRKGQWRWRLRAKNGRIVANSGESYRNRADCNVGIELVMMSTVNNTPIIDVSR